MPESPLTESEVAAVVIDVEGTVLSNEGEGLPIARVEVRCEVDRPSSFVIECSDLDATDLELIDDGRVAEGRSITIKMGFDDDLDEVFAGEITGLELDVDAESAVRVTIRGYDRLHRLTRGRKTRAFVDQKDSAIVSTIARENELDPSVEATSETHEYVLQSEETDLAFLSARARAIGYTLFVDDKSLFFVKRGLTDSAALTITQGSDLLSLSIRTSVLGLVGGVEVRGWDPKEQAEILAKGAAGDAPAMGGSTAGGSLTDSRFGAAVGQVTGYPVVTKAQAEALALAEVQERALTYVTCEVEIIGDYDVKASSVVAIDGFGTRFSGNYYVDQVTHTFDGEGYRTTFQGKRTTT